MSDEYRELRQALSDGPSVGPWTVMPANAGEQCVARINRYEAVPPTGIELSHDSIDAAYIAAANPETVIRLLGEVDALRAENERLRSELGVANDTIDMLRQDAERYRHIRSNIDAVQALVGPDAVLRLVGGGLKELGRYCDECIDDVMRNSGRVSDE